MAEINLLEGDEKIKAIEKAIKIYEVDFQALSFAEKAIEFYKGDPKAIPFIDVAKKCRKNDFKMAIYLGPVLIVGALLFSGLIIPFLLSILPGYGRLIIFSLIVDLVSAIALLIGTLVLVIGIPYYSFSLFKLNRMKRRLQKVEKNNDSRTKCGQR